MLILFYHIFLYPILLRFVGIFTKNKTKRSLTSFPTITVLCPAFNEEKHIEAKIKSFLQLDYPQDKIKLIVISDDSTDKTNEIVRQYTAEHNIELVVQKPRRGKPSGHNLVEPRIDTDFVLSTDANSIFQPDAVLHLVKAITQGENIGLVSGELRLVKENKDDSGEGIYWKYENFIKKQESKIVGLVGANGSIFLIRRELFSQIHPASVDDFERALIVREKKYQVKYCPQALVTEFVSEKSSSEIKRKIRIISREWFALLRHHRLLNPFLYPAASFVLISHKLIRWLLPVFSIFIIFSNLALYRSHRIFPIILIAQLAVYFLGILGLHLEKSDKQNALTKLPAYWVAMNYSALLALYKFVSGQQQTTWSTKR
jgi:cellulose synthase/poly-beta-1,6-N-acetylglucosamine synthase-like glycosyltransferase